PKRAAEMRGTQTHEASKLCASQWVIEVRFNVRGHLADLPRRQAAFELLGKGRLRFIHRLQQGYCAAKGFLRRVALVVERVAERRKDLRDQRSQLLDGGLRLQENGFQIVLRHFADSAA